MLVTDWKVSNNPYRCGSDELRDTSNTIDSRMQKKIDALEHQIVALVIFCQFFNILSGNILHDIL